MAEMVKVKGTKVRSKLAFIEDEYGQEMVGKVLASLAPEDRRAIHRILDLGWYPANLYDQTLRAIVAVAAGGDEGVLDRIGEYTAEHQSAGAYKVYYKSKDVMTVLRKMVPMHSMLNDPGEMEVIFHGPRSASIVVRQPPSSRELCRVARAFYQRTVELCGQPSVSVAEVHCSARNDPFCEFKVTW
jgi:predicted hydrocarbon binding protein